MQIHSGAAKQAASARGCAALKFFARNASLNAAAGATFEMKTIYRRRNNVSTVNFS
jgi:hypothetical protein